MISLFLRCAPLSACALALVALLGASSCRRPLSADEKATRAELRQALHDQAHPRAIALATRIAAAHSQENGAWARLVRAQLGAGDLPAAKQTIEKWRSVIRQASPKRDELTGDVANQQLDRALALEAWSRALAQNPAQPRVLRKIARLQSRERRWAEEDAAYTKLLTIDDNAVDRMSRALVRRRQHRWTEAFEDQQRAVALAPQDPDVRRGAKIFERLLKVLPQIRQLDARLSAIPTDDQSLSDRALLFLRSEDPDLALTDSQAALAIAPAAICPRLLGALALLGLDRIAESEALGVDPALRLEQLTPEFLETMSRLDAEISVEPQNADLRRTRAWHLNDIGQPQLALTDTEMASLADPPLAAAAVEAAYALAKLGRLEEAAQQITRATELDATSASAWQYRGELELSRGAPDAAIASLSRALALTQTPAALQKREQCYRQLGALEKAEEDRRAFEQLTGRGTK
ncbi:MAG: hypothetical protein ABI883_01035 [Chthoniobacterales bacterium]